jgi:hypothetical protein
MSTKKIVPVLDIKPSDSFIKKYGFLLIGTVPTGIDAAANGTLRQYFPRREGDKYGYCGTAGNTRARRVALATDMLEDPSHNRYLYQHPVPHGTSGSSVIVDPGGRRQYRHDVSGMTNVKKFSMVRTTTYFLANGGSLTLLPTGVQFKDLPLKRPNDPNAYKPKLPTVAPIESCIPVPVREPWVCPNCGKAHPGWVETCPFPPREQ